MDVKIDINKCEMCRKCEEVCDRDAIILRCVPRRMEILQEKCNQCHICLDICKFIILKEKGDE